MGSLWTYVEATHAAGNVDLSIRTKEVPREQTHMWDYRAGKRWGVHESMSGVRNTASLGNQAYLQFLKPVSFYI